MSFSDITRPWRNRIIIGDALETLKTLPDNFVQCCVTSPPYFGLRDYGTAKWEGGDPSCKHIDEYMKAAHERNRKGLADNANSQDGGNRSLEIQSGLEKTFQHIGTCKKCGAKSVDKQIGLEQTPEEYVAKLVEVFREVRRVLKNDGAMFLNLGDSYSGASCGISDREPEDYLMRDYLCENLCGVCRRAYLIGKFRKDNSPVPMQVVLSSLPNHEHMVSVNDHSPTSDSFRQEDHNEVAIHDLKHSSIHGDVPLVSSRESMHDEFYRQPQATNLRLNNASVCPLCGRTSVFCIRECGHKMVCIPDIQKKSGSSIRHKMGKFSSNSAYQYLDNKSRQRFSLKPKDLIGIPWMVAFALRNDGWHLRSDIIWAKRNCMPESVEDRPSRSHEYLFLLTKSPKYYYDAYAIREDAEYDGRKDELYKGANKTYEGQIPGGRPHTFHQQGHLRWQKDVDGNCYRNKRDVWHINTEPLKDAHFAVFPRKLVRPCIEAGSSEKGCCQSCGKPWIRVIEKEKSADISPAMKRAGCDNRGEYHGHPLKDYAVNSAQNAAVVKRSILESMRNRIKSISWQPSCSCEDVFFPCIVLDPFVGSGTTPMVAKELGRSYLGIDLNPKYLPLINKRVNSVNSRLL